MNGFRGLSWLLLSLLGSVGLGCIIVPVTETDAPGAVTFLWSFDGEPRCDNAGVQELDIDIQNAAGSSVYSDTVECVGGGLTIRDIPPGAFEVTIFAVDFQGQDLYQAEASGEVTSGVTADLGTIEFSRLQVPSGQIELFWAFLYPANSPETSCDKAGVYEVDVEILPVTDNTAGMEYSETFRCDAEGVSVSALPVGEYVLRLRAYGVLREGGEDVDLLLYDSGPETIEIVAGDTLRLGDVSLERHEESFAGLVTDWTFTEGTCAELGISEVSFSVTRLEVELVDDTFTVECDSATTALRAPFVPGSYLIEASAQGTSGAYFGAQTVTLLPNEQLDTTVELVFVAP